MLLSELCGGKLLYPMLLSDYLRLLVCLKMRWFLGQVLGLPG